MSITVGPDGPEGSEEIKFARYGVRVGVVNEKGEIVEHNSYTLAMLGGTIPAVGDRMAMLWPEDDQDAEELIEIISRHYVGEFYGDNCWWLLAKPCKPSKLEETLFGAAREASKETRRVNQLRTQIEHDRVMEKLHKSSSPTSGRKPGQRSGRGRSIGAK